MTATATQLNRAGYAWEYTMTGNDRLFLCQHNCGWAKTYAGRLAKTSWNALSYSVQNTIALKSGLD